MTKDFRRELTAERLNEVANSPEVRGLLGIEGDDPVDLTDVVRDRSHYVLMHEHGGVVFLAHEPGLYEGHALFREAGRESALTTIRLAVWWMFTKSDMVALWMKVAKERKDVLGVARSLHARKNYDRGNVASYSLNLYDWVWQDEGLEERGRKAAAVLGLEVEPPEAKLLAYAIDCVRGGQALKGISVFNRAARFIPWWPLEVLPGGAFRLKDIEFTLGDTSIEVIEGST